MKQWLSRLLVTGGLAVVGWLLLGAATPPAKTGILQPDQLVILSTVDVKGKATPCG